MGADAFVVFYGVRETIPADDTDQLDLLESRTHPLLISARAAGLDRWWGRLTDGSDFHVLIGARIGVFGVENDQELSIDSDELLRLIDAVRASLESSGIRGTPALHCQLEAQY
jgi:hypothetical protein